MQKIPTLFKRELVPSAKRVAVVDEVTPGCEWVLAGEGQATRKFDGACVKIDRHGMWARREVKPGQAVPVGFVQVDEMVISVGETEPRTWLFGWVPVNDSPEYARHWEAWRNGMGFFRFGTYELIGPKVNGNPEGVDSHVFVRHGSIVLDGVPRDWSGLRDWCSDHRKYEGIVFWHEDGRKAKIKLKDFDYGEDVYSGRNRVTFPTDARSP